MDDLSEKITQILNDPGSLQQIMEFANALGGQQTSTDASESGHDPPAPQEMLSDLTQMLRQAEKTDKKQEALCQALRPFLKPNRQERLERAMQIAHLSHLAGIALRSGKGRTERHEEVDGHL